MATLAVAFYLEMLTFGHPEAPPARFAIEDAERAYGHSRCGFLLGNAYIWPPRELGAVLKRSS